MHTFTDFSDFCFKISKHAEWGNRHVWTPFISVTDSLDRVARDVRRRRRVGMEKGYVRDPVFAMISTSVLVEMYGGQIWKMDDVMNVCGLGQVGKKEWYKDEWVCKDWIPAGAVVAAGLQIEQFGFPTF